MRTCKIIFLLVGWLSLSLTIHAQYHFRTIDSRSGLPDNYVSAILKDKDGFMWIATPNGLSRYDGFSHRLYEIRKEDGSVELNIRRLEEDQTGQMWITTYDGSLFLYDRMRDQITPAATSLLKQKGIPTGKHMKVFVDADKNLWCIDGKKITYYRCTEHRIYTINMPEKVMRVACRDERAYALTPSGKVFRIAPVSGFYHLISQLPASHSEWMSMYIDAHNQLWFFGNYIMGVFRLKPQETLHTFSPAEKISNLNVLAMTEDKEGNLWWGTNSNGLLVRRTNGTTEEISHHKGDSFSLPSNHVSSLLIDNGLLWVGSSKTGLAVARLGGIRFDIINTPFGEDVGFISQDAKGTIWIGYDGTGLTSVDNEGHVKQLYNMSNSPLASNLVIGGTPTSDGNMYLGTYGGGLYHMTSMGQIERILPKVPALLYVKHAIKDRKGNLWIGSLRNGLWLLTPHQQLKNYNYHNSILQTDAITDMKYSPKDNRIYVATGTGLYYVSNQGKLENVKGKDEAPDYFLRTKFNSICIDPRGLLWVASNNETRIYDAHFQLLHNFGKQEGLSQVLAMTSDKQGNVWITTNEALICVNVSTNEKGAYHFRISRFVEEDGLGEVRFSKNALCCLDNGEVLAGANGKVVRITPAELFESVSPSRIIFTNLFVGNTEITPGMEGRDILKSNISCTDQITLNHDDDFTLTVSSLNYRHAAPTRFAYRLGTEGEWIAIESNRINISHLSAGKYTLQVKTIGGYNDEESIAKISLVIQPPFYLSPWAWLVYILLILSGIWGAFIIVRRRQREKLTLQQMLRERKYQQEMDEAKMRFLTNFGHDIRTPLSLIISPIEQLLADDRFREARKSLEMVYRNAKSLLNDVNQLIDFRRLDNQMEKLELSMGDMGQFLIQVSTPYIYMADKKEVKLSIKGCEEGIECSFDKPKLKRIVANLLSNAIKFTPRPGSVQLQLAQQDNRIIIRVSDTGIGIKDKSKIFHRFYQEHHAEDGAYTGSGIGLHIVKEYIDLMRGEISVSDNQPQGSVFEIALPTATTEEMHTTKAAMPDKASSSPHAKKQILVVEDNDDLRDFVINCLSENYQVAGAANGREALEWLQAHEANMVITDLMMPEMDGMQLCHTIKTDVNYSHMPVIMLTAKAADEHILSGYQEGADDYITKPFNVEILKMRIAKLFEWMKQAEDKFRQPDMKTSEVIVSQLDGELIDKATKIVEAHLADTDFTVEAFGEAMCMSRSALYKKLMAISGRSPLEFMRIIRLRHGLTLVRQGGLTVSEVAYKVGMSPKQFAKFFKEEYGSLPSKYV